MELGRNGDRAGPLGEKGGSWLGRSGSGTWKADTFKVVALPVSVKDRSVGPWEQVLNVPIAYRWYEPDKPSSLLLIDVLAFSTASLVGSEEKLGTGLRIGQSACCELCWKPFFSRAVTLSNSVNDSWKVATYWDRPQEICHVGQIFPYRVYIDSNHRDSWIWVTACLCQSSLR
jgi:hypothetical protein